MVKKKSTKKTQRGGDILGIGKFITNELPGYINKGLKESKVISKYIIPAAGVVASGFFGPEVLAGTSLASKGVSMLGYGKKQKGGAMEDRPQFPTGYNIHGRVQEEPTRRGRKPVVTSLSSAGSTGTTSALTTPSTSTLGSSATPAPITTPGQVTSASSAGQTSTPGAKVRNNLSIDINRKVHEIRTDVGNGKKTHREAIVELLNLRDGILPSVASTSMKAGIDKTIDDFRLAERSI